ncbi:MAG: hypothetical protein ACRDQW_08825 [Haloechinothrix sp.]
MSFTNARIALLAGWLGLSVNSGTPRLMDTGTSRLDGMCAVMGEPTTRSMSAAVSPTLASARFSTISR